MTGLEGEGKLEGSCQSVQKRQKTKRAQKGERWLLKRLGMGGINEVRFCVRLALAIQNLFM